MNVNEKEQHKKEQEDKLLQISKPDNKTIKNRIGRHIFSEKDILNTNNVLDMLLRFIFVQNEITIEYFNVKFRDYAKDKVKIFPKKMNSQRNNLLKALRKGNISYFIFITIIVHILEYNIEDLAINLNLNNSGINTYRLSDIFKFPKIKVHSEQEET